MFTDTNIDVSFSETLMQFVTVSRPGEMHTVSQVIVSILNRGDLSMDEAY
jgi:hypothetical protein